MTRQISVATIFSGESGLILECQKYATSDTLYFNCTLLSAFFNEDETELCHYLFSTGSYANSWSPCWCQNQLAMATQNRIEMVCLFST